MDSYETEINGTNILLNKLWTYCSSSQTPPWTPFLPLFQFSITSLLNVRIEVFSQCTNKCINQVFKVNCLTQTLISDISRVRMVELSEAVFIWSACHLMSSYLSVHGNSHFIKLHILYKVYQLYSNFSRLKWNFLIRREICQSHLVTCKHWRWKIEPVHKLTFSSSMLFYPSGFVASHLSCKSCVFQPPAAFHLAWKSECSHVYPWSKEYEEAGYGTGYKARRMHSGRQRVG